eukprot:scaffold897_cov402-Prasinococcus_capsulatus_cf.AAC.42
MPSSAALQYLIRAGMRRRQSSKSPASIQELTLAEGAASSNTGAYRYLSSDGTDGRRSVARAAL